MKNKLKKIVSVLFSVSFLYYIFWLGYCILLFWKGTDSSWAAPSLGDENIVYGWQAFGYGIWFFVFFTCIYAWYIPLFQIIYGITKAILKRKSKHNKHNMS